jgi:hypothetical protein
MQIVCNLTSACAIRTEMLVATAEGIGGATLEEDEDDPNEQPR